MYSGNSCEASVTTVFFFFFMIKDNLEYRPWLLLLSKTKSIKNGKAEISDKRLKMLLWQITKIKH